MPRSRDMLSHFRWQPHDIRVQPSPSTTWCGPPPRASAVGEGTPCCTPAPGPHDVYDACIHTRPRTGVSMGCLHANMPHVRRVRLGPVKATQGAPDRPLTSKQLRIWVVRRRSTEKADTSMDSKPVGEKANPCGGVNGMIANQTAWRASTRHGQPANGIMKKPATGLAGRPAAF